MKKLYLASIIYLILPYIIFLIYWTVPLCSIVCIALLILSVFLIQKDSNFNKDLAKLNFKVLDYLYILIGATFLCYLTGVEGTIPQKGDYWVHNSKLFTLFKYNWPIVLPEADTFLCYYWGTFMLPALFSKWTGAFNPYFSTAYTFVGCFIGFFWFYINSNKKGYLILILLSIGGFSRILFDFYGNHEANPLFGIEIFPNYMQLLISPNQFVPVFIVVGIYIYYLKNVNKLLFVAFPIAAASFWAIFPTIIIFLICLIHCVLLLKNGKYIFQFNRIIFSIILFFSAFIPLLFYYSSNTISSKLVNVFDTVQRSKTLFDTYKYFGLEFLIFISIFILSKKVLKIKTDWLLLNITICVSVFFALFKFGRNNDLFMRGIMTTYIIFGYFFTQLISFFIENSKKIKLIPAFIIVPFFAGHLYFFSNYCYRNLSEIITGYHFNSQKLTTKTPYNIYPNVYQLLLNKYSIEEANQYLGSKKSIFYKYLIKK